MQKQLQLPLFDALVILVLISSAGMVYAASYSGDGTYLVKNGDIITANNGYSILIKGFDSGSVSIDFGSKIGFYRSILLPLDEATSFKISTATMGGPNVLELRISSINGEEASVTVTSIYEPEEKQPEIPAPGEEKPEVPAEGKTYSGDGVYTLAAGDSVEASNGVVVKVTGFIKTELRWVGEWPAVEIEAYKKEGIKVAGTHLLSYKDMPEWAKGESAEFTELGLSVIANYVDLEKKEAQLSISSSAKVTLQEGWNLFSVPLRWYAGADSCENAKCYGPGTNGLKVVESTCGDLDSLKVWYWNAEQKQYVKSLPYAPFGYWVKVDKQCTITFGRELVSLDSLNLKVGWNQIGGPTKSVNFNDISGSCNVVSGPWVYSNQMKRYEKVSILSAGGGYFVKVTSDCTFGGTSPPVPPQ